MIASSGKTAGSPHDAVQTSVSFEQEAAGRPVVPARPRSWLRLYSIARRGLTGFQRGGAGLAGADGLGAPQEVGDQQRASLARSNVDVVKQWAAHPSLQPFIASLHAVQSGEPHQQVFVWLVCRCLAPLVLLLLLWTTLTHMDRGSSMSIGEGAALLVLFVLSRGFGALAEKAGLHPLCGMLLAGFTCRYLPGLAGGSIIESEVAAEVRMVGLALILVRAGLSLRLALITNLIGLCSATSLGPTLVECVTVAALSRAAYGWPWTWGLMTGAMVSGVAAAVVVPVLLTLQQDGYGTAKGLPSLVLAVAALDDVLAVVAYAISAAIVFEHSPVLVTLVRGPAELVLGAVAGLAVGLLGCLFLPPLAHKDDAAGAASGRLPPQEGALMAGLRSCYVGGMALLAIYGCHGHGAAGAGAMSCLVLGMTAQLGWGSARVGAPKAQLGVVWNQGVAPLLFGIIGIKLDPAAFTPAFLARAGGLLGAAMLARGAATLACAMAGKDLTANERAFLALAWVPKATVQAALAPEPLARSRARLLAGIGSEEEVRWAETVFALGMLSVFLSAPLGAILLKYFGPKLLKKGRRSSTGEDAGDH
ncbi:Na+/H+ antiporter [Klebsormidium nitens]|uniref:Na+/H+ antiporter n=1 Tax=Klebsormidium nitens TaxID=105231 RepID=A0A1Y1IJH3_KLENI|nr:Na+/H+ antiporter [Klebsormidium nitens]|eukprot:GAQ89599.1 Na+/H+ antiporter [Klebsormidium nitens]